MRKIKDGSLARPRPGLKQVCVDSLRLAGALVWRPLGPRKLPGCQLASKSQLSLRLPAITCLSGEEAYNYNLTGYGLRALLFLALREKNKQLSWSEARNRGYPLLKSSTRVTLLWSLLARSSMRQTANSAVISPSTGEVKRT